MCIIHQTDDVDILFDFIVGNRLIWMIKYNKKVLRTDRIHGLDPPVKNCDDINNHLILLREYIQVRRESLSTFDSGPTVVFIVAIACV